MVKNLNSEVKETFFDITIELFLAYQTRKNNWSIGSLESFYNIFKNIGLDLIPIKTVNFLIINLQKQTLEETWIKLEFIEKYFNDLPISTEIEYKEKIKDLLSAVRSKRKQELQKKILFEELDEIIDETN